MQKETIMSVARLLESLSPSRANAQRHTRQSTRRSLFRRRLFETLEERRLMVSDWQNPFVPTDVNNDRAISAIDTLLVINKLNQDGGMVLPGISDATSPGVFYDTSGDGQLSALDVLQVINTINGNADGNQLTSVVALSSRSVLATFKLPVADALLFPEAYRFQGESSNLLEVFQVVKGQNPNQVILTTGEQTGSSYVVGFSEAAVVAVAPSTSLASAGSSTSGVTGPHVVDVKMVNSTTIMATYSQPMGSSALDPRNYQIAGADGQPIQVLSTKFLQGESESVVQLQTAPIPSSGATFNITNVTDSTGAPVSYEGRTLTTDNGPRVVGAISQSTTSVLVSFSEPMADGALLAGSYSISQTTENKEAGGVIIYKAEWYQSSNETTPSHRSVLLTTSTQNEVTYSVVVSNVTALDGTALSGVLVGQRDAVSAQFRGTPPSGLWFYADGDGLADNAELRGWVVNVKLLDGTMRSRQVTSDTRLSDTDYDRLTDADEFRLGLDPRSPDTDGDQLGDYAEFNELFSNPNSQDTDGDSLDDNSEFSFYKTSPNFSDTDGDQLSDGYEILANRNPRVSDLPQPNISVGEMNLKLDVRFEETNQTQKRDLETKSVTATLTSDVKTLNTTNRMNMQEGHAKTESGFKEKKVFFAAELYGGGQHTMTHNDGTEKSTQQAYQDSLTTDREVTDGFTVQRHVQGAVMQVAIDLGNLSTLAFRIKNLQVTAFIADPRDPTALVPVATLLPDSEPADGFTLGPLMRNRGPFIFSNTTIIPSLVESFLSNPTGLVFKISNYDIIDEKGRNFGFSSQEVVERTGRVSIDYGGASFLLASLKGEPVNELVPANNTESFRVATGTGGLADTNQNGKSDDVGPRVIFDSNGKGVGISAYEALAAIGLTHYDELEFPTSSLTDKQILASFATKKDSSGFEKIVRIRGVSNDPIGQKYWELVTALGVDRLTSHDQLLLGANSAITFNYVQDLDGDGLTADVEAFFGTSDSPLPVGAISPDAEGAYELSVRFDTDPDIATGALVRVTADTAGLKADTNYFVSNRGGGTYRFFASRADALSSTNPIVLTSAFNAGIFTPLVPAPGFTDYTFNFTRFSTGQRVRVTASGGGLIQGSVYFVRALTDSEISLFDTAPNANNLLSNVGRIDLTDSIAGRTVILNADGTDMDSYVPFSTNTTGESISFKPGFLNGTAVRVTANTGGLKDNVYVLKEGQTYYLGKTPTTNSFYSKAEDAINKLNPIQLYGDVSPAGIFTVDASKRGAVFPWDAKSSVTLVPDPDLGTGALVRLTKASGGLTADKNYWVSKNGDGSYSFYANRDNALSANKPILLTSPLESDIYVPTIPSFGVSGNVVDFNYFNSGTSVRVSGSGGGLRSTQIYFVRSLGKGEISLFTSEAAALNSPSTEERVDLKGAIISRVVKVTLEGVEETEGFKPVSTDITNDSMSFDPGYETGTSVRLSQGTGGIAFGDFVLKAGVDYYLRKDDFAKYGFYLTKQDALDGKNAVRLMGEVARAGILASDASKRETLPLTSAKSYVTLSPDPDFSTGTLVRLTQDSGGLKADTDYFVANRVDGAYSFFATRADALSSKNPIVLTSELDANVYIPQVPALGFKNNLINFDYFVTGQAVRVASSSGGLNSGTVYYVRATSGSQIRLFDNPTNAGNTKSVVGLIDLSASIVSRIVTVNADGTDGTSYKPVSTDITTDRLSFDPKYPVGTRVQVTSDTGGTVGGVAVLKSGTNYYLGDAGSAKYAFYATEADAVAGTNRITLTGEVASAGIFLSQAASRQLIRVNNIPSGSAHYVKFNTDPDLATGTPIQFWQDAAAWKANTTYFLRNVGDGVYSFHNSKVDAERSSNPLAVDPDVLPVIIPSQSSFKPITDPALDSISFDPNFANSAQRVKVLATGGGLTGGKNYWLLKIAGGAAYSFYDSVAAPTTTTADGRVALTGPVTSRIEVTEPSGAVRSFKPVSTDLNTQSITFAPNFATGSAVRVMNTAGGLSAGDYFVNNNSGKYTFHRTTKDATTGQNRIDLIGNVADGFISLTASGRDTDRDGLDDRFETLIGWNVSTPTNLYHVYSSPVRRDTNFDNPTLLADSDVDGKRDQLEYDGADRVSAPGGWDDRNGDGLRDQFEVFQIDSLDLVLDPVARDTDGDGINDVTEVVGFQSLSIRDDLFKNYDTNPLTPYSDSDTFTDGFEKLLGLDPRNGNDTDEDGDGLPDLIERDGWEVGNVSRPAKQTITLRPQISTTYELQFGVGGKTQDNTFSFSNRSSAAEFQDAFNNLNDMKKAGGKVSVSLVYGNEDDRSIQTYTVVFGSDLATRYVAPLIAFSTEVTVNTIDEGGRFVEQVSKAAFESGDGVRRIGKSATDSVDTDEDGLTDYEEFFLHTDAGSADSDNDGIDDRTESLGYALGHLVGRSDIGIIKTDPLDADTDNDMRSDGAEAELKNVEVDAWIVQVAGKPPQRVYSNPLIADADFDGLVDGLEFNFNVAFKSRHSDPNNSNTDGDPRNDLVEYKDEGNPLVDDFAVTVYFTSIYIGADGDTSGGSGDFNMDFGIRKPDPITGRYSDDYTSILHHGMKLVSPFNSEFTDVSADDFFHDTSAPVNSNDDVQIATGQTFSFAAYRADSQSRSHKFNMTVEEMFAIEGVLAELDTSTGSASTKIYIGGMEGVKVTEEGTVTTKKRAIFTGSELRSGPAIRDLSFDFTKADNLFNSANFALVGKVFAFIVIG